MPLDDPNTWLHGAAALKTAFDALRSAIAGVRDVRTLVGESEEQKKTIDAALDQAARAAGVAEAEIAKALGYELCKCEFPPTPMLTVGFKSDRGKAGSGPVYECPKCGYTNAGPWGYTRLAPKLPPDPIRRPNPY